MTLRIQCPACQRQFKVNDELKGRTVECGACEKQFVVDTDAIVPERDRYFPGDIKKSGLDHYGRAPAAGRPALPVGFATATYNDHASAADVIPAPPQRTFATVLGVGIQLLFTLILLFGSQENGILKDMEHEKRIVLAGFVALMGAALIGYGSFRRRKEAIMLVLGLSALVVGLAIFLPVPKTIDEVMDPGTPNTPSRLPEPAPDPEPGSRKMTELEAKSAMGYDPVEKAFANFGYETVVALWAPDMKESFKYQIQRYLHRKAGTGARPSFYSRGDGALIVIEGTRLGMPEVEVLVERFARVEEVYPNLRVIKISMEGERLLPPSPELERKIKDKSHPAFYAYNQAELDRIDIDLVREAAKRLSEVEPKRFRPEIAKRLVELLQEDEDADFQSTICNAILVWSVPGDGAEQAVARVAQDLLLRDGEIPRSMIEFLAARKVPETVSILEMMWKKDPSTWESLVVDLGQEAESAIWPHLADQDRSLQRSAIVILRRIGSPASLPALRKALEDAAGDSDLQLLLKSAIDAIEGQ